jgi:hypothetical protein
MAKYTKVWENGTEKSTLNFRGRDFTLAMSAFENGESHGLGKGIDAQINEAYPDDEDLEEILDTLEILDDSFDRDDALERLTEFES